MRRNQGREGADADKPTVDVWHPKDVDVMPKQKVGATRDRQRTLLAAWPIDRATLTVLGHDYYETVVPLKAKNLAYAVSWQSSALERSWGRFGAVDGLARRRDAAASARRWPIASTTASSAPARTGKYILYYIDGQFSTIDTARRTVVNITKGVATSFVDRESDSTDVQRPWFGVAGWTTATASVLLYDKYDVWEIAANGSPRRRV